MQNRNIDFPHTDADVILSLGGKQIWEGIGLL